MTDLSIATSAALGLALVLYVQSRVVQFRRSTLLDWSVLSIAGGYFFGWCVVLAVTTAGGNARWSTWLTSRPDLYLVHNASVLVLAAAIVTGWVLSGSTIDHLRRSRHGEVHSPPERKTASSLTWKRAAWTMLLVGVAAHILFTLAHGGPFAAISAQRLARAGFAVGPNQWSFLRPLGGLTLIASLVFWGFVVTERSVQDVLGATIGTTISFGILFSWGGRLNLAVFALSLGLGYAMYRNRRPALLVVRALAVGGAVFGSAYVISRMLHIRHASHIGEFVASELSFYFASFFAHMQAPDDPRWFVDILGAPLFLLPSSIWEQWMESTSEVNTVLLRGAPKGAEGVTGGIPVDMVTLGYMQLPAVGVVVVGVLFGICLRVIQAGLDGISEHGVRALLTAYVTLSVAVTSVFYSQPDLLAKSNVHLIAAVIILGGYRMSLSSRTRKIGG